MSDEFDSMSLQKWFVARQRALPWRENRSPYNVWVSEIMLQQTQVSVVVPYFERWMRQFPTIEKLALASESDVMKAWEGLGYYSRARNLHAGAKYILDCYNGHLPSDHLLWDKIKGLGAYTKGALRSFAFHQRAPVVDGNVLRVLTRYFGISDDISKQKTLKTIWMKAEKILPQAKSWVHNEALIELGATICTKTPKCQQCPLMAACHTWSHQSWKEIPYNSKKCPISTLKRAVGVIKHKDRLLVRKCAPNEIMAGLYEFPYLQIENENEANGKLAEWLFHNLKLHIKPMQALEKVKHSFTRYSVTLYPSLYITETASKNEGWEWIDMESLKQKPFSAGHRKIFQKINED